jgi:hypothetical protein
MTSLPSPLLRPRLLNRTLRATGAAGLVAALLASLVACKDGDAMDAAPLTPAGEALRASAPDVAATPVLPPPVIQTVSTTVATPVAGPASTALAPVQTQLETTLANASACTVDTECHSVAVGAKACGGPTGYRAYSSKTVSSASVDALAQHERDLAAAAARESHQVSTCFMLADPGAHCQQGKCVTGPPATN